MVSSPFTNPNKVCNPSGSSERRKMQLDLNRENWYTRDVPKVLISLLPAMQHGWKLYQIIIYSLSITAWQVLCYLKEQPEIYPKTVKPSMYWPIKQTVHIRDLIIQTIAVSAIRFHGCSIFIHKPTCPVYMANFLYDMGFLGPLMYGYATVSCNQILTTWSFDRPKLP